MGVILWRNFDHQRVFAVGSDIRASREELVAMSETERARIDLILGHLSYGWHVHLPRPARYFTFVRDPVKRVISHFDYVRFRDDYIHYNRPIIEERGMTLGDYVSSGICDEMNNGQIRLLAGVEDIRQEPFGKSQIPYGSNEEVLYERAIANIERDFFLVGLQERFLESLLLLKIRMGLRKTAFVSFNVGSRTYQKSRPSEEELAIIKAHNLLDQRLHQWAGDQLEAALAEVPRKNLWLGVQAFQNWFYYQQVRVCGRWKRLTGSEQTS